MIIYLAGGITGNLNKLFKIIAKEMDVYLAGTVSRKFIYKKCMDIYLAREHPCKNGKDATWNNVNILESYYYIRDNKEFPRLISSGIVNFLLDSGAFTFMSNTIVDINWDNYIEEYAEFINKWDIKHFFELDIDSIVGIQEVERLRRKLEYLTQKKCIPVWHKQRGKDYFIKMCQEYSYVAIGGIVTQEIPIDKYEKLFPWFIKTAHLNGTKIHGLGYTRISNLKKYHFDSVDSTAWLYGNRGGFVYNFNPKKIEMEKVYKKSRLKSKEAAMHNFLEWVKFSKYAEKKL